MDFTNHPLNTPIANRNKVLKPIANSQLVDQLLNEHTELIDARYVKWFAKRFYRMHPDLVQRLASEAKVDGRNPQQLFTFLIKKNCP